jgi:hypothetical protein
MCGHLMSLLGVYTVMLLPFAAKMWSIVQPNSRHRGALGLRFRRDLGDLAD